MNTSLAWRIVFVLALAAYQVSSFGPAKVDPQLDDGLISTQREYHWHVVLHPNGLSVSFAGFLISEEWVVTAATSANKAPTYELGFGYFNRSDDSESDRQNRTVEASDIIFHPEFKPEHFNLHNIALMRLNDPVFFNVYVGRVNLPPANSSSLYVGEFARITGFGSGPEGPDPVKRYADMTVMSNSQCASAGADSQMCTEVLDGVGPCRDEGAALVYTEGTSYVAIGVFSYGYAGGPCPGPTALFTRMTSYVEWITGETNITTGFDDIM